MSDENGRCGRVCCYWCLASVWGMSCLGFIVFLFVHSNMTEDVQPDVTEIRELTEGYLALYPGNKIIFNMSDAINTTKTYTEILKKVVEEYNCVDGFESCENSALNDSSDNVYQPCQFDVALLGNSCTVDNSFGYLDRKPCILLRLEEINFVPEAHYLPLVWRKTESKKHAFVECHGTKTVDATRLRTYQLWPTEGFPISSFAGAADKSNSTCDAKGPLVAVQFPDLVTGRTISIYCQVWASNDYKLTASKVTFNIHIH